MDIIGINETTGGSNASMYLTKPLSWVRDTAELGIKTGWAAGYRDVIILGPQNGKVDSFNLTDYPIYGTSATVLANRAVMKKKLVDASKVVDSDNDKLPDFWEMQTYGNLSRTGASVEPGGLTALTRYAHCVPYPGEAEQPNALPRIVEVGDGSISVVFLRRRGQAFGLSVTPEFSKNLTTWGTDGYGWEETLARPLYDGTCGMLVEWNIALPGEWRYLRVRSTLP